MAAPFRVVDTSAWIEWLTGSVLGKRLSQALPDKLYCVAPRFICIFHYETEPQ